MKYNKVGLIQKSESLMSKDGQKQLSPAYYMEVKSSTNKFNDLFNNLMRKFFKK